MFHGPAAIRLQLFILRNTASSNSTWHYFVIKSFASSKVIRSVTELINLLKKDLRCVQLLRCMFFTSSSPHNAQRSFPLISRPPLSRQYLRESELPDNDPSDPESRIAALRIEPGTMCQFCGQSIAEVPSLEEQATCAPEELFCCSQYRELLDYALKHPLNQGRAESVMLLFAFSTMCFLSLLSFLLSISFSPTITYSFLH